MVRALSPPHRRNLALAKQMINVKRIAFLHPDSTGRVLFELCAGSEA